MTTLGKILVFVNLVLSLLVGSLIVSTYVARTDWRRAYNELDSQTKIAVQNARAADADKAQAEQQVAQLATKLNDAGAELAKAKDAAAAEVARAKGQVSEIQSTLNQANANLEIVKQELVASQKEKDYLRDRVAQLDQTIQQQKLHVQDSDNRRVEAEINLQKVQGQNERLLAQNETLTKELQAAKQSGQSPTRLTSATKRRPPAEDVEGVVKSTDADSGYIKISIGSDAGLNKGNTLEVYRLKPEAAYLGMVEIVAVRPDEAVARPSSRMNGVIQVGDRVSSSVAPKR